MTTALWIVVGFAIVIVVGYFLTMRNLFRKSREVEKQIDHSKIRKWKDDEDGED